jgi:2-hydroxy-3-oxopropionate reductase
MEPGHVAIVGLGQMGTRYASRLLGAGWRVTVWNRSADKADGLVAQGARRAASLAEVASFPMVISALENAGAFEETMLSAECMARWTRQALLIDTATVGPTAACGFASRLAARGVRYVDCPVSGGTRGAAEGNLTLLVGADDDAFTAAQPLLRVLGRPHLLGPVGHGQSAKLANQTIVAGTIAAVAEGLRLAQAAGLDGEPWLRALQGGFADSRILQEHGRRMLERDFAPGAANRVFLKDLNAISDAAARYRVELPATQLVRKQYQELVASGRGELDHSSYFEILAGPPGDG